MTWTLRVVCASLLAARVLAAAPPSPQDAELAAGVALAREGDFQGALLKLDEALRRLELAEAAPRELAQGYLYLGIAYLELGQEMPAVERFRAAALRDPELRLHASEFSPQVIRFFETARQDVAAMSAGAAAPGTPAAPPSPSPSTARWGAGKTALVVVGAAAAVAAVVAVANADDGGSATTSTTLLPAARPAMAWASRLDVPGASGRVVLDGDTADVVRAGPRAPSPRALRPGRHHLEATLTRPGSAAGTWRFDLASVRQGTLYVTAGTVLSLGSSSVVFRVAGRPGERVAFSFETR